MNQMAAAVALAQVERVDYFIELRRKMGVKFTEILSKSELLRPQLEPRYYYSYYTFSAKFNGDRHNISWSTFRKKFMSYGGDGIYAASKLLHQSLPFATQK